MQSRKSLKKIKKGICGQENLVDLLYDIKESVRPAYHLWQIHYKLEK